MGIFSALRSIETLTTYIKGRLTSHLTATANTISVFSVLDVQMC